jgi:prefoldin subunit 5
MISIVGPKEEAAPTSASALGPYVKTQDPDWYAAEATKLHDQLERLQTQLAEYRQAIDDTRSLRETSGGINLVAGDVGITPQSGIEILQQRVNEIQARLDALEDLARRNGIAPGTLRVE